MRASRKPPTKPSGIRFAPLTRPLPVVSTRIPAGPAVSFLPVPVGPAPTPHPTLFRSARCPLPPLPAKPQHSTDPDSPAAPHIVPATLDPCASERHPRCPPPALRSRPRSRHRHPPNQSRFSPGPWSTADLVRPCSREPAGGTPNLHHAIHSGARGHAQARPYGRHV